MERLLGFMKLQKLCANIWVHEHFSGKRLRAPRFSQGFTGPKISRILKNRYTSYMASTWTWILQAQIWKQVKDR